MVFIEFETFERGSTCDHLVREFGLVVIALVALIVLLAVDLLMSVLSFVCRDEI